MSIKAPNDPNGIVNSRDVYGVKVVRRHCQPKMAASHIVVEYPIGSAKTVFTNTADEDRAYLKIFWKSIHLNPTIESRLVSSDVRQRVPSLPLKSHGT